LSDDVRRAEADLTLPPPDAADVGAAPEVEDLRLLEHFTDRLRAIDAAAPLGPTVAGGGFGAASYRLSLLALLADGSEASPAEGPIGAFMQVPLAVRFETGLETVGHDEIEAVSRGDVRPRPSAEP
ncbi:MAG: hypothetical protein KDE64_14585, partial [Rhodocyclaceae bacterium]|nr:hypothetical protein [Rhodocyclaceae bacterium]